VGWRAVTAGALGLSALVVSVGTLAAPAPAAATGGSDPFRAAATFVGPITGGHVIEPETALPTELGRYGYVEQEFFASGTAHAYGVTSSPVDGRWTVEPSTAASYRTRVLVRRPADPARFSGTVVVEWMNVSEGESAPDWMYLNPELMAAGDAWVGVSAQALAVDGGTPILGSLQGAGKGLVAEEPERYGSLHHPGDDYALDLFDQVGLGLRADPSSILGPLRPRHIVAVGESQSAFYLTTFADAIEPESHAFDGIFIHSRAGTAAPPSATASGPASGGAGVRIRTDLHVPVFMFETQTDVIELGYAAAQQPDSRDVRTWEVAGTSHADSYILGSTPLSVLGCTTPINTGPQHLVVQAAFADFVRWVVDGTPPPSPPPFRLSSRSPPTLALDRYGNVIGGVRTPAVNVPTATLSQIAPPGTSVICSLFGSTTPFSAQMLATLYGTKAHYLARYTAALDRAIAGGYVLPAARAMLLAEARQVTFPAA